MGGRGGGGKKKTDFIFVFGLYVAFELQHFPPSSI
jgi:hypothetical protein